MLVLSSGACGDVEERPFQGRVASLQSRAALGPVVVFFLIWKFIFSPCDGYHLPFTRYHPTIQSWMIQSARFSSRALLGSACLSFASKREPGSWSKFCSVIAIRGSICCTNLLSCLTIFICCSRLLAKFHWRNRCNSLRVGIRTGCARWRRFRSGRRVLRTVGFAMRRIMRGIASMSA